MPDQDPPTPSGPGTGSVPDAVAGLSRLLVERFDAVFAELQSMAEQIAPLLVPEDAADGSSLLGPLSTDLLETIRERAVRLLKHHALVEGAGVIFDPHRIAISEQLIQWQVRREQGGYEPYGFVYDAESTEYYDFMRLPWFRVPQRTGAPTLTGPYLDYLGVDDYVLTGAVPVLAGGTFAGVTGVDIQVSALERTVIGVSRSLGVPLALVAAGDRIVCSNTAHYLPGDRFPARAGDGHRLPLPTRVPTLSLCWV